MGTFFNGISWGIGKLLGTESESFLGKQVSSSVELGCNTWNVLVAGNADLYLQDPLSSNVSGISSMVNSIASGLATVATTLVVVFFLIAIIKECSDMEQEGQWYRIIKLVVKMFLCAAATTNSMAIIRALYSGTSALMQSVVGTVDLKIDPSAIGQSLDQATDFWSGLLLFFTAPMIGIIVSLALIICSISIFGNVYTRIIVSGLMAPFAGVFFSMQMASGELQISAMPYVKTVISNIISGAFCYAALAIIATVMSSGGILGQLVSGSGAGSGIAAMFMLVLYPGVATMVIPKIPDMVHRMF